MEENKNRKEEITYGDPKKSDYYISRDKKVKDFLFGFFGTTILSFFYINANPYLINAFFSIVIPRSDLIISDSFQMWSLIFILGLVSALFFKISRRFIAIGILTILMILIINQINIVRLLG